MHAVDGDYKPSKPRLEPPKIPRILKFLDPLFSGLLEINILPHYKLLLLSYYTYRDLYIGRIRYIIPQKFTFRPPYYLKTFEHVNT